MKGESRSQSRPLRDRLAEASRLSRIGSAHPTWAELPEHTREDHRQDIDRLIASGPEFGFEVRERT